MGLVSHIVNHHKAVTNLLCLAAGSGLFLKHFWTFVKEQLLMIHKHRDC